MPIGPTRTKAQKQQVVKKEMNKFGKGELHSGSKEGPVVTNPKQAVAISMSESKQSKPKSKRTAKTGGYDRSGHFPGNPGFNREGKPPYKDYDGGAHAKQPHGKSTGEPDIDKPGFKNYGTEQKEHWGNKASGKHIGGHAYDDHAVANVGSEEGSARGSELTGRDTPDPNHKQPHGKSIGAGSHGAEHHKGYGGTAAHTFRPPPASNAHNFQGTQKRGLLRVSGHSGAHQIGKR